MRYLIFIILFLGSSCVLADDIYHNPESEKGAWPFISDPPACDDYYVLRKIMHDFENREREFWASDLFINQFDNIKQTGFRPYGMSYTPRRYCQSNAVFGDGVKREVYYMITPDQSVILAGQVIDWCVVGIDRAHVDGPNCLRVRNAGQ